MGMIVSVLRNAELGDCTNGGITGKVSRLCVVNVEGPFEPREDMPAVMLVENAHSTCKIVPAEKVSGMDGHWRPIKKWWMMGGNYATTSDSRFSKAVEKLLGHTFYGAVAVHDRTETAEQSAFLSR